MAKRPTRGFGLLELLIALVILGLLMTGFARFFSSSLKGSRNVTGLGEYADLLTSFRLVLRNSSMCKCNLAPASPAPRTFPEASTASAVFPIDTIQRYSSGCASGGAIVSRSSRLAGGLTLREMSVRDFFKVDDANYMAKLHLEVDKPEGSVGGPGYVKDFQIAFKTTTSAGGTVTLDECVIAGEEEPNTTPSGTFWNATVRTEQHSHGSPSFTVPSGKALVITQVSLDLYGSSVGAHSPSPSPPPPSGACYVNGVRVHSITKGISGLASLGSPLAISSGSSLSFASSVHDTCSFSGYLIDEAL